MGGTLKERKLLVLSIFAVVFVSSFVFGALHFDVDEDSYIVENAFAGDFVSGELIMNFSEQPNANFTSNFQGGIALFDLLEDMGYSKDSDFTCNPIGCANDYFADSEEDSKSFTLGSEKRLYGFLIANVENVLVNSFDFEIDVTNSATNCENQLSMDLFNDGTDDIYNTLYRASNVCGAENFGCFDEGGDVENVVVGSDDYYCEKVFIGSGPSFRIGAYLSGTRSSGDEINFKLYDIDWNLLTSCTDDSPGGGDGNTYCEAEYASSNSTMEGFVCIKAGSNNGEVYEIESETDEEACGGVGNPFQGISNLNRDFKIYAQKLMYDNIGSFVFKDKYTELNGAGLKDDVNAYLTETYGGNCSKGCVIPLSFRGVIGPTIKIENVNIGFKEIGGVTKNTGSVYELNEIDFLISTENEIILDVEKMRFIVPEEEGPETFDLDFEGVEIASETIDIEVGFDFTVGPIFVLIGKNTVFNVFSNKSISSSVWDFGDDSAEVNASSDQVRHTYTEEGNFIMSVDLIASDGDISKKRFNIVVGEAKTSARVTMEGYLKRIGDIKSYINSLPEWVQDDVERESDIGVLEASVNSIKKDYDLLGNNSANSEYVSIITRLLDSGVPRSISTTNKALGLPLGVGFSNMNVGYIAAISSVDSVSDSGELKDSIISWIDSNYDATLSFETISAVNDIGVNVLMRKYKVSLTQIDSSSDFSYLIIGHPKDSIRFRAAYGEDPVSGGLAAKISIDSSGDPGEVEFVILSETAPEVEDLGIYISPLIEDLDGGGKPYIGFGDDEGNFRWVFFLIWMAVLLVVIFIVYMFLQSWYKKYYERHLFKNPNDLYNIINFIYNSRRIGLTDTDIRKKLRGRKWKREQITYAFKKIDGKRTGMWEIPVFKFMENRKVEAEIRKKQGGRPIDARFIKRPGF